MARRTADGFVRRASTPASAYLGQIRAAADDDAAAAAERVDEVKTVQGARGRRQPSTSPA
jgi:hypothetical protein